MLSARVAGSGPGAVDDAILLDEPDTETREVVVVALVHARHLGRLAADERATRLQAAFHDALDDALRDVDLQAPGRVVVEEEDRLGALHDDVVRAHCNQVDADRVVTAGLDREAQLGADAVGAGDHDRLPKSVQGYLDEGAKSAEAAKHFRAHRALHGRLDALDELVARVDVHAGVAIGGRSGVGHADLPWAGCPGVGIEAVWYFTRAPAASNSLRTHA